MSLSLKPLTLETADAFCIEWMAGCQYAATTRALVVIAPGDKLEWVVELLKEGESEEILTVCGEARAHAIALALLTVEFRGERK